MIVINERKIDIDSYLQQFEKRFGTRYSNIIKERLQSCIIKDIKEPYCKDIAFVDGFGNININVNYNSTISNYIEKHEITHKIDNVILLNNEKHSHFTQLKNDLDKYEPPLREFVTEWITTNLSSEKTYIAHDKNKIIEINGLRSAYDLGANLIDGISAIVGEELLLDVYTGVRDPNELVSIFNNSFNYPFSEMCKNMDNLFYINNINESYHNSVAAILEAFKSKLLNSKCMNANDLEKDIIKINRICPKMLEDNHTNDNLQLLEEINTIYNDLRNDQNLSSYDANELDISTENKQLIKKVVDANNQKIESYKKVGNKTIPLDKSHNPKNNLYRLVYQLSSINDGIYSAVLEGDKYIKDILSKIQNLPDNISTDEDISKYEKIYNYANLILQNNMVNKLQNGTKGILYDYRAIRSCLTNFRQNSMVDTKTKQIDDGLIQSSKLYTLMLDTYINENEQLTIYDKSVDCSKEKKRFIDMRIDGNNFFTLDKDSYSR